MDSPDTLELVVSLDEPDDQLAYSLQILLQQLSSEEWVPRAPQFMDEIEDAEGLAAGDIPIRTTALSLTVLAPSQGGQRLPPSEDQRQFRQAERFLGAMSEYSLRTGARLRVFYNGEEIGEIAGKDLSRGVVEGLLTPWRKEVGL